MPEEMLFSRNTFQYSGFQFIKAGNQRVILIVDRKREVRVVDGCVVRGMSSQSHLVTTSRQRGYFSNLSFGHAEDSLFVAKVLATNGTA
jgi:hypothetical protein